MATVTLASLENMRSELVNSKYYLNIRSGYMAPVTLHCSYGDSGQSITFYIFDGGEKFSLDAAAVTIHGTRRDGANFGPFNCTTSGNAVTFTLQSSMTAVEGSAIAEFTISRGGVVVGTCNFAMLIENAVFPNGVAYDSDPSVYQDILKYVQGLASANKSDYISRIQDEASARIAGDRTNSSAISVERARIDNYLSSGTSATNSELVDIRVKANGETVSSAGKAVRDQIGELRNNMRTISAKCIGYNILYDVEFQSYTSAGVTISGNAFNGVLVNGTNSYSTPSAIVLTKPFTLKKHTRYRLYEELPGNISPDTYRLDVRESADHNVLISVETSKLGVVFWTDEAVDVIVCIRYVGDYTFDNMLIKPHLEEYDEEIPVIVHGHRGNNLITPASFAPTNDLSRNGIIMTNNFDGSLTANGSYAGGPTSILFVGGYNKIVLQAGHTYIYGSNADSTDVPSLQTYMLNLRKASDSATIISREYSFGGVFRPTETEPYLVSYRVETGYNPNGMIIRPYLCDVEDMDNKLDKDNKLPMFRLCGYNVGNFANGESGVSSGTDEMFSQLLNVFRTANADIYAFTEWDEYWNTENEVLSEDKFAGLKPYHTLRYDKNPGRYTASMNYSDYPFLSEEFVYFADGESRSYTDNTVIIGDKLVHIINTHLPWSSQTLRHEDIDKIFQYIEDNNIDRFVIVGDFNMGLGVQGSSARDVAIADINYFLSKGVYSVQGGFWGGDDTDNLINTYPGASEIAPYDNIVTSKNIFIRNAFALNMPGSDHIPLCADLVVLS